MKNLQEIINDLQHLKNEHDAMRQENLDLKIMLWCIVNEKGCALFSRNNMKTEEVEMALKGKFRLESISPTEHAIIFEPKKC